MRFRIVVGFAGALAAGPGLAQAGGEPKVDCRNPQGTPEVGYCAEQDFDRADARLNVAYKAMLRRIDTSDFYDAKSKAALKAAIQDAQRKWLAFRDADCKQAVGIAWNGGTGTGAAISACMAEKTVTRAKEFESRPQT